MSPSLPPPPRKLSSSSASGNSASRYPKINPNSLALAASDPLLNQSEEDQDLDRALAELLGQSTLSTDHHPNDHHPQCRYYTSSLSIPDYSDSYYNGSNTTSSGRPLSITSLSSLGSGSFTSYGTHSRRVSQAFLSPLSPALSEPSSANHNPFFNTVPEHDECSPPQDSDTVSETTTATATHEQAMRMGPSLIPLCTYCARMQMNSVYGSGTADSKGLNSSSNSGSTIASPTTKANNRKSFQMAFDTNRLVALREFVPSEVRLRLTYHLDECWFAQFSPDGKMMASTGLDQSIIIWQNVLTLEPTVLRTFQFARSITHVHWSPDSTRLLVNLGFDPVVPTYTYEINIYDVLTGEMILSRKHTNGDRDVHAFAVGWMGDSKHFVTAPSDGQIFIWNIQGEIIKTIDIDEDPQIQTHVEAMHMIPGQNAAVITDNLFKVRVISLDDEKSKYVDRMASNPSSMVLSPSQKYLAISIRESAEVCRPSQILIYDFKKLKFLRALEADTYINKNFVIHASFTGPNDEILATGSENGIVHFWDIESGELILERGEHSQHCGWTEMHPTLPGLMASCSDDNHIILWTTKDLCRALQDEDDKWMELSRKKTVGQLPVNLKKGW
ncbi:WD repeat-containing protein 26 [Linnemannia zychae]|nr:WD repeat-containing protein 26 [Linnemannia zychae]